MGLACTLGLTACLTFGGTQFTAEDAVAILDECELMARFPEASFVEHPTSNYLDMHAAMRANFGALAGQGLAEKGLKLEWPPNPGLRKRLWLLTCKRFEAAFYDRSQGWSHLDRWPW